MTYDLDGYIDQLGSVIANLKKDIELVLVKTWAEDMANRIQTRVEMNRLDSKGSPFSSYSKSYLKWKQDKKGFIGTDKNFALTREMWSRFGAVNKKRTEGSIEIGLGGKNKDAQVKINTNTKREGISIIEASKQERDEQDAFFDKWLAEYLSKRL